MLFAVLHFIVLTKGFKEGGESALVGLVIDFPLFLLISLFTDGDGTEHYVLVCYIGGTIFYALVGAVIGSFVQLIGNAIGPLFSLYPDQETFITFWKNNRRRTPPLGFYGPFLGGLLLYALVIPRISGAFWLLSLFGAIAYLIFVPYIALKFYWRRYANFLRCPQCGDWFGRDFSGALAGPNPKWIAVSETGRCANCGKPILPDVVITVTQK